MEARGERQQQEIYDGPSNVPCVDPQNNSSFFSVLDGKVVVWQVLDAGGRLLRTCHTCTTGQPHAPGRHDSG